MQDDKYSIGNMHEPKNFGQLWSAGINVGSHGNAIEVHRESKEKAEALRDKVFVLLTETATIPDGRDAKIAELERKLAVPEGYALVPIEPTDDMIQAAMPWAASNDGTFGENIIGHYKAMLAAAQQRKEST